MRAFWHLTLFVVSICAGHTLTKSYNSEKIYSNIFLKAKQFLNLECQLFKFFNYSTQHTDIGLAAILKQLQVEHDKSKNNTEMYLTNVLHVFQLTRRMSVFWKLLFSYMNQTVELELPTVADFDELKAGLHNIQQTYKLKPADIVGGLLYGIQYDIKLSSYDCWLMGEYTLDLDYPKAALEWFEVALEQYSESEALINVLLEYNLANIWFGITKSLFELHRDDDVLHAVEKVFANKPKQKKVVEQAAILKEKIYYDKICRGDFSSVSTRQRCSYDSKSNAFLKIAPLKVEQLLEEPYLVVYYDAIHDSEIVDLKIYASQKLERGIVGDGFVDEARTASAADLLEHELNKNFEKFNRRIEDITDMYLDALFTTQIINYGLGGHYYNHVDYYSTIPMKEANYGNRKAAIILYMSDVPQGGATAFPAAKTAYFPKKGTALVWHHLNNAGDGERLSLHAGCPVVFGSKWIALRLLYYNSQIFRKPCMINKNSTIRTWL